jgi:predicted HAD superfamily Cof-like phosphohydrolase
MATDPRVIDLLTEQVFRQGRLIEELLDLIEQQSRTTQAVTDLRLSLEKMVVDQAATRSFEQRVAAIEAELRVRR